MDNGISSQYPLCFSLSSQDRDWTVSPIKSSSGFGSRRRAGIPWSLAKGWKLRFQVAFLPWSPCNIICHARAVVSFGFTRVRMALLHYVISRTRPTERLCQFTGDLQGTPATLSSLPRYILTPPAPCQMPITTVGQLRETNVISLEVPMFQPCRTIDIDLISTLVSIVPPHKLANWKTRDTQPGRTGSLECFHKE